MERNLVILALGIAIGYFLFKNKAIPSNEVIQIGDKGKDIEGMQKMFEKVSNLKFNDYGVYDEDTQASVLYLLKNTSALKDSKGSVNKNFASDISKIYFNSLTI